MTKCISVGAGIGEANLNLGGNKGADQTFCAVHAILAFMEELFTSKENLPILT